MWYFSYSLCSLIYDEFNTISNEMVQLILSRTQPNVLDENDGQSNSTMRLMKYKGELYLRRLYSISEGQNMVGGCNNISNYVGSRQQYMYGCVCFMVVFFSMYDSVSLMKLKNIDWFQGTVIKGGCSLIRNHSSIAVHQETLLQELGGMGKTIAECIFNLVNTANLSGGFVGPGNSLWFHSLILKLSGVIGPTHKS